VLSLEYLMTEAYNRKLKNIPLRIDAVDVPSAPDNPFVVDTATVNKIKRRSEKMMWY